MYFQLLETKINFQQILLIGCLLLIIYISKRWKFYQLSMKMPTVWGLPFIGIALEMMPMTKIFPVLDKHFEKLKSSTFVAWVGMKPYLITVEPEVIASILTSPELLNKADTLYTPINNAIIDGLMSSKDAKWHHNRRLMQLSFSHKILANFLPIFNRGSRRAVDKLESLVGLQEHGLFDPIKRVVLATGIETTLGIQLNDGDETNENVVKGFNFMLEKCAQDIIYPSFLVHTPHYFRTIKFLRRFAKNLVIERISLKEAHENIDSKNNSTTKRTNFFIDQAIGHLENGAFKMQDVISESHTMIAGSFDTISTTVFSVVLMLAMHTDIQEKVFDELYDVFPDIDFDVELEQLDKLTYLEMVINETLRVMPSIPIIGRQVEKDTVIAHDIVLPQGMQIVIPIYNLHRRKDIWGPDADTFNPDNFLPENIDQKHAFAYIPFSKGNRNCIGMRYAYISLRVMLIRLLRNFKFSTSFKYINLRLLTNMSLRHDVEPMVSVQRRT